MTKIYTFCKIILFLIIINSIVINNLFAIDNYNISQSINDNYNTELVNNYNTLSYSSILPEKKFGIYLGVNYNNHHSDFQNIITDTNYYSHFTNGTGTGFALGFDYELKLPDPWYLGLRIGFSSYDAKLKYSIYANNIALLNNDTLSGSFDKIITTNLADFGFEPYLSYSFPFGLNLFAGGRIGWTLQNSFSQYEELSNPKSALFIDTKSKQRNDTSGVIPYSTSTYGAILFGISYDLPITFNKTWMISPEIFYYKGMSNIATNLNWTADIIRLGFSIKYAPQFSTNSLTHIQKTINHIDTVFVLSDTVQKEGLIQGIPNVKEFSYLVDNNILTEYSIYRTDTLFQRPKIIAKIKVQPSKISLKTQLVTEAFPLLPIIFFNRNSYKINNSYLDTFSIAYSDSISNSLLYYNNIFSIISQRMSLYPDALLYLSGASDITIENEPCQLAQKRSVAVRNKLISLGVDSNKIVILKNNDNCYPSQPTLTKNDSGYTENQRVTITSNDYNITAPISKKQYFTIVDSIPNIIINPSGSTMNGIKFCSIKAIQNNDFIFYNEYNNIPKLFNILINSNKYLSLSPNIPIQLELSLKDASNNKASAREQINFVIDTSDIEISRLSILLFEVSSSDIPKGTRESLINFFDSVTSNTEIIVKGYSDNLGDYLNNKQLALNRAKNTANLIKVLFPKIQSIKIEGYGSDLMPAGITSYSTPQERFLSRSVQIEIIKHRR